MLLALSSYFKTAAVHIIAPACGPNAKLEYIAADTMENSAHAGM